MARKTTKDSDDDKARPMGEGTLQGQRPAIPKAKRLGGNTYIIAGSVSTTGKPIPKKHRKSRAG